MKVLVITHNTSNTGAPKTCLTLLQSFKLKVNTLSIDTVSLDSGYGLDEKFTLFSENFFPIDKYSREADYSLKNKFFAKLKKNTILSEYEMNKLIIENQPYDFVFANTIASLSFALEIKKKQPFTKLFLFLHEMCTVIDQLCPSFRSFISEVDLIGYISSYNRKLVEEKYIFKSKNFIELLPHIKINIEPTECKFSDTVKKVKKVVMMGSVHWRKGDDVFIQVARKILLERKDIEFYWIGSISNYQRLIVETDLNRLGIQNHVFFVGEKENPFELLSEMDLFLLTSREEPFGLAPAEAILLGIPLVYFTGVTGIGALLEEHGFDHGVPYLDIDKMSEKVLDILENKKEYIEDIKQMRSILLNYDDDYYKNKIDELFLKLNLNEK
jgi:glycosyltransferase involved in cell wall biosynthesis